MRQRAWQRHRRRRATVAPLARPLARLVARLVVGLVAGPIATGTARAQFLRAPEFDFEPGALTVNSISAPIGQPAGTGFNVRVLARLPTSSTRRVAFVVGVRFAPYGTSNGGALDNEPVVFYGLDIPVLDAVWTRGWVNVNLPLFLEYRSGGGTTENPRPYGHDLVAEVAVLTPLGQKLMRDMGPFWSGLGLYLRVDQNLTPNDYTVIGRSGEEIRFRADRWSPSFQYGLNVPFRWTP